MKSPDDQKPEFRFTPDVLKRIRRRARDGATGREIAGELGCDYGSLRNVCSRHGISLRASPEPDDTPERKPVALNGSGAPRNDFCLPLGRVARTVCQREALLRGVSLEVLAAALLERVASDNLFKAVLDD